MARRPQAQMELMPAADSEELQPLIKDVRDFCWDFGHPPTVLYVYEWAEEEYGYHISMKIARSLLEKGLRLAGWASH